MATPNLHLAGTGGTTSGGIANYNTVSGVISGSMNVRVRNETPVGGSAEANYWRLTGVNTYSGQAALDNDSHLVIDGAGQLGSGTYNGNLTMSNSATFEYSSTADQALSGTLSGTSTGGSRVAALIKDEASTLTITGNNSYTGPTTVNGGILLANNTFGSATGSGAVAVNSTGTLGGVLIYLKRRDLLRSMV